MLCISIQFLAGKYHANPWGKHINEGVIEWPIAPFRLLRSWIAAYENYLAHPSNDKILSTLLEKCCSLPNFHLPPATTAHTRHYMPIENGKKTALIFDSFVHVGKERLYLFWNDIFLEKDEKELLEKILSRINYLGRSQSWVEMKIEGSRDDIRPNCFFENPNDGKGYDIVKTICAKEDFRGWKADPKQEKSKIQSIDNIREALSVETSDLKKDGWSAPPGSRMVMYFRSDQAFKSEPNTQSAEKTRKGYHTARYQIDADVLPMITETLSIAEHLRNAMMKFHKKPSENFSGKNADGLRLKGHQHASFIPEDLDGDGRIDHVTIHSAGGFTRDEMITLSGFRMLRRESKGLSNIHFLFLGYLDGQTPKGAKVWESKTPFLAIRHPKIKRQKDLLVDQVRLELKRRGFPEPVKVEHIQSTEKTTDHPFRWHDFRQWRPNKENPPVPGEGFRVTFEEPISIEADKAKIGATDMLQDSVFPTNRLSIGRFSHFGMGLFVPVDD